MHHHQTHISHFIFSANQDGYWGWQKDYYEDGFMYGHIIATGFTDEFSNRGRTKKISPLLARSIEKWQDRFEKNVASAGSNHAENCSKITFDWNGWNKAGVRLLYLLKEQLEDLYDDYYFGFVVEDVDYEKVWSKVDGVLMDKILLKNQNEQTDRQKQIVKTNFLFGADYGGAWGWEVKHYDDGSRSSCNIADCFSFSTDFWTHKGYVEISAILARAIEKWQTYFERYAVADWDFRTRRERMAKDTFDWERWNKAGVRLAFLLFKQIGHLYDEFYYDFASEDIDNRKVWKKTKGIKID